MHTGRKLFYRFRNFGLTANQITFTRNGDNEELSNAAAGEQISVADYFAEKFGSLIHPNLPCINASKGNQNKPNWLPMEVVRVSLLLQINNNYIIFNSITDSRMATCSQIIG